MRRALPALQRFDNLRWLETESDYLVAYAKDDVICVVNVDADHRGARASASSRRRPGCRRSSPSHDVLRDTTFEWQTGRNYVALGPGQSHVLKVVAPA